MPYKNLAEQREYQRKWMARRREEFFRGKSCVKCASTENLELEHIDPKLKVSQRNWSWTEATRLVELAKCQVLCNPCHKEKSGEHKRSHLCADCRKIEADRKKGYREAKKAKRLASAVEPDNKNDGLNTNPEE
ncbi:MAG: hypothetical protein NVS9B9_28440 [Ktedonobacteraceae bacterium]